MDAWLQHPAFQSALAPLLLAAVAAPLLARARLSGLAVTGGVLLCVHLALGLDLVPRDATHRIAVLIAAGAVIGAVLDRLPGTTRVPGWLLPMAAVPAAAWVVHGALSHRPVGVAVVLGTGLAAFAAVTAWGFDRLRSRPLRAGCAGLGAGIGTGVAAVLGASASLGQVGLALGAACGGFLLAQALGGRPLPAGRTLTLPASLTAALVALAAVVLASLPWYALPFVAVAPYAAGLPLGERWPPWRQAVVHGAVASVVGLGAAAAATLGPAASSYGY